MHKHTCIGVDETFHSATQHSQPATSFITVYGCIQPASWFFTSKQIVKSFLCGNSTKDIYSGVSLIIWKHTVHRNILRKAWAAWIWGGGWGVFLDHTWWIWYVFCVCKIQEKSVHSPRYGSCIWIGYGYECLRFLFVFCLLIFHENIYACLFLLATFWIFQPFCIRIGLSRELYIVQTEKVKWNKISMHMHHFDEWQQSVSVRALL